MKDSNLKEFNKWFMDNIASDDGGYNKPEYEAAKWAWEEQQKKIDEKIWLFKNANSQADDLAKMVVALRAKLNRLKETADWHIEDCCCNHPMSQYELGWFEAMTRVKEILK